MSRAELKVFTVPAIGHCPPQEVLRTAYRASAYGGQRLGEHVLSGKMTVSFACSSGRFYIPIIRARPPQEVLRTAYGASACGNSLCEHLLSGKPAFSFACGTDRFYHPAIRISKKGLAWLAALCQLHHARPRAIIALGRLTAGDKNRGCCGRG